MRLWNLKKHNHFPKSSFPPHIMLMLSLTIHYYDCHGIEMLTTIYCTTDDERNGAINKNINH